MIRTSDGDDLVVLMGPGVDLTSFGTLRHLLQHQEYGWLVEVTYRVDSTGTAHALRLDDA